ERASWRNGCGPARSGRAAPGSHPSFIGRADGTLALKSGARGVFAMTGVFLTFGLLVSATALGADVEPGHARNPVYRALRGGGWSVGEPCVEFPAPTLRDGASAGDERAELQAIAGSERAVGEFTRDSVTAPVVVRTHDVKAADGLVRRADVWFVVHAD